MTTLNVTATTDGEGKVRLATGIPNARVQLAVSVIGPEMPTEEWRERITAVLGKVGPDSLVHFPSGFFKDPWEADI